MQFPKFVLYGKFMGHRRMQYLNEIDVSERDLLVGDCRRRRWPFVSRLDFGSVLKK